MSEQASEQDPRSRWEHPALTNARRLAVADRRKPTESDAPKLSVLPMTRAARHALELSRL